MFSQKPTNQTTEKQLVLFLGILKENPHHSVKKKNPQVGHVCHQGDISALQLPWNELFKETLTMVSPTGHGRKVPSMANKALGKTGQQVESMAFKILGN